MNHMAVDELVVASKWMMVKCESEIELKRLGKKRKTERGHVFYARVDSEIIWDLFDIDLQLEWPNSVQQMRYYA